MEYQVGGNSFVHPSLEDISGEVSPFLASDLMDLNPMLLDKQALTIGEIPFEDMRLTREEFGARKAGKRSVLLKNVVGPER